MADATTIGTITLTPTIECIGVIVTYTGDDNEDNSVVMQYREGEGEWKTGIDMYDDRANQEYRASIFWLTTNTEYEVKVTFTDTDGVSGTNPLTDTVTTINDSPAIGTSYLYVATDGNDSTGDGTISKPWRTIVKAAGVVDPGDTVYIREGTYSETVTISRSGTYADYITFMPYPEESVLIDCLGTITKPFAITGNYIRIKGFTMQDTAYNSTGAMVQLSGADYCIVEDNTFINPLGNGCVDLRYGASHNLIQNNEFTVNEELEHKPNFIYWWNAGGSQVIRNNIMTATTVHLWDGMGGGPENEDGFMDNTDIYDNTITFADFKTGVPEDGWDRDDAIQLEGSDVNVRIWGNIISYCNVGIGICPVNVGPCYVFRNVFYKPYWEMFKMGDDAYGRQYLYHNTMYASGGADGLKRTNTGIGNVVAKNNLIHSGRYVYELPAIIDSDFDYNSIYTTDGARFCKFGSTYYTFTTYKTGTGQDSHSISVADPGFADEASGDLTLNADSPCVDVGAVLPYFNDENSPWPYTGEAPDLGAYEFDQEEEEEVTPVVTTNSATAVESTTATLNGEFTDTRATVTFYWGESDGETTPESWDNSGAPTGPGQPQTSGAFLKNVTSLLPDTTYYFTAKATNGAGTDWGETDSFVTESEEPVYSTIAKINGVAV